ncbi:hypothetical protein WJX79_008083 [Trebouxia sp. C0005]
MPPTVAYVSFWQLLLAQPMFGLVRAASRSFVTDAAAEGFVPAAQAFKDAHPTWPWALGLSGSTLVTGFAVMRVTLHSAERDLDILRQETKALVNSSMKQEVRLEQITESLMDIKADLKAKLK